MPIFTTFKIKSYFQLKSRTPSSLCSNVIYKFTCPCDTDLSYVGVTIRHLVTRIREHLDCSLKHEKKISAIKKHLNSCQYCFEATWDLNSNHLNILEKCKTQYEANINEALIIKKESPKLNIQQFNKGASFLLNIFWKLTCCTSLINSTNKYFFALYDYRYLIHTSNSIVLLLLIFSSPADLYGYHVVNCMPSFVVDL